MLRLDRGIRWVAMPFFAVDSAVKPQNDASERASARAFPPRIAPRPPSAGFNVMLRLDRSIHWVAMPFFAVDSAVEPQNDMLWKGFNAGFFAADCRLENCGSSLGLDRGGRAPVMPAAAMARLEKP